VVEQQRVLTMSKLARQAGIQTEMRVSSVHMLMPEAQIKKRDTEKEQASLYAAAMASLQFTPQVCLLENASILMGVGASLTLFGGLRRLRRLIINTIRQLGLSPQLGIAVSAQGAWLLAQQKKPQRGVVLRYALSQVRLHQRLNLSAD